MKASFFKAAAQLVGVAKWVADSFPIIRMVFIIAIVILAIALTIVIFMQSSNSEGVGAITGQSETFFSKNKARTLEGTLKRLTVIFGILFAVLSILFFVSLQIYNPQ